MKKEKQKGPYTKFGPWFKAQFGRDLPSGLSRRRLEQATVAAQVKALRLERQSSDADRFDDVHDAALKGWVAGYDAGKYEALKDKPDV